MRYPSVVLLLACGLFLQSLLQSTFAADEAPATSAKMQPTQQATPETPPQQPQSPLSDEQKSSIIQFYTWSGVLPKDLMSLKTAINAENIDKILRAELPKVAADIRDLQWNVTRARSASSIQKIKIDSFQRQLGRLSAQVTKFDKSLTDTVSHLSTWRNDWTINRTKLTGFTEQKDLTIALVIDQKGELNQIIDEAINLIDTHLEPALTVGKELTNLQVRLQTIDADLREINKIMIESRTRRTSPTVLSPEFYKLIEFEMLVESYTNTKRFLELHYEFLKENARNVAIGVFLFIILCECIYLTKNLVIASSRWYPFASSPLATTVFIITASCGLLNRQINLDFESQWNQVISILTVFSVIHLVKSCIDDKWKRKIFSRLALFMAFIMLFGMLDLPQLLMLLFVFITSIIAFVFYINSLRIKSKNTLEHVTRKFWGMLPALVIILSLAGYAQFAIFTFTTSIASVSICLIIWMLFHLNCGFLELLLKVIPLSLLHDNFSVIVKSLQPFIALFHIMLAAAALSVLWDVFPSIDKAFKSINDAGFDIAGLHISPGFLLTIYFILYGAMLFSRATQALLLKEVLPRYKAEKGVQLSITRLVHYAILTIGFFVMLKVLGFELQQLTILGGALGVGIGFGLQAIVNNFVSGLILLFERPIKVGDTIQVGTELGEVKNLGLRATIIQTFDNSEIVVPNADLVTGQVTNWTLAERMVRVKIPVGVAYGSDVAKVMDILKSCADTHPMVLNTPKPLALFLAFGASSLDFELRFWIPEFLDKMIATSELNQSIESEFALNNIEIPFMQTDLHIRSIDTAAAMALSGKQTT